MHKFDEIVNKVAAILRAELPTEHQDVKIFNTRTTPFFIQNLPAINIYITDDNAEKSPDEGNYLRRPIVSIQISVAGDDEPDKVLEAPATNNVTKKLLNLREAVEFVFRAHYMNLEGLIHRFNYVNGKINYGNKSEEIPGTALLNYEAQYREPLRRGNK